MSNANSAVKVLRTALKRIQKGWTKGSWIRPEGTDEAGKPVFAVCLEGAIFGYCDVAKTNAQREARDVLVQLIREKDIDNGTGCPVTKIPAFNDLSSTTQEDVEELIKQGIIRLETGGLIDPEEFYIDPEEVEEFF